MYKEKLEDLEENFFAIYPEGFNDEELVKLGKRHSVYKRSEEVHKAFSKENFTIPDQICQSFADIVSKSSLISYFEKPKVKKMITTMSSEQKDIMSIGLYELLYGDKKDGFESLVEVLSFHNLANWSLVTLIPYYYYRDSEFFIKPTTTKNILKYFEIDQPVYKPKPSYEFYKAYTKLLQLLKKISKLDIDDNAGFTGFFMLSLKR